MPKLRSVFRLALSVVFGSSLLAQHTINVPKDQPTIQAGIVAAANGDTVLVAPGTYLENIDFLGKAITVTSSAGAGTTILDGGQGRKPAVTFKNKETSASVFNGFTVQNGGVESSDIFGGTFSGIWAAQSSPTISHNIITHNHCYGIYSDGSSPLILDNEIDNTLDATGGCTFAGGAAIWLFGSLSNYNGGTQLTTPPARVIGNLIQDNTQSGKEDAGGNGGVGVAVWGAYADIEQNTFRNNKTLGTGVVYAFNTDNVTLIGNLIYNNHGWDIGGVALEPPGESAGPFIGILENNTIYGNTADHPAGGYGDGTASQVYLSGNLGQYILINNIIVGTTSGVAAVACGTSYNYLSYTPLVFDHNNIYNTTGGAILDGACPDQTGTYGNISADPLFNNATSGDFHLRSASPSIDTGNSSAPQLTSQDLDGKPRVADATGKGYPIVDMGAFEAAGSVAPAPTILTLMPSTYYPYSGFPYGNSNTPFTLTASALSALGVPTGPITFYEDMVSIGTVNLNASGSAVLQVPRMVPGVHAFLATYPGQGAFSPAFSVKFFILVPKYGTTLTLSSSKNPSFVGDPVTFTVTSASDDNSVPSPITLTDNYGSQPLATLTPDSSGKAIYTTSSLTIGYHSITASYAGDATRNSATASVYQTVNDPYATSITAQSSLNPSIIGQQVTFTAKVTSVGGATPTGTLAISDGAALLYSNTLDSTGAVSFSTSALAVGTHSISFDFQSTDPAQPFKSSHASVYQYVQAGYNTSTTVNSSANPSSVGQPVTFTARVSSGNGIPTGSVSFSDGANALGTQPLDASGSTSFTTSGLARGQHNISATYVPVGTFAASSNQLTQNVNGIATVSVLGANPLTYKIGDTVQLTATISSSNPATVSGTVLFYANGISLGSATVLNGAAVLSTASLKGGQQSLTCAYSGDTTFAPSTCAPFTVTGLTQDSSLSLTSSISGYAHALNPFTITARLTSKSGPLRGNVVFSVAGQPDESVATDANGLAAITYALPVGTGSQVINAAFAGDTTYGPAAASLGQPIAASGTSMKIDVTPNPAYQTQTVTIKAQVNDLDGPAQAYGRIDLVDGQNILTSVTIQPGQAPVLTYTMQAPVVGNHYLQAAYSAGDKNFLGSLSTQLLTVLPQGFTFTIAKPTMSIQAEHHATVSLMLNSFGGFVGNIQLACGSPLPPVATCELQPSARLTANNSVPVSLTIDTDAVLNFKSESDPSREIGGFSRQRTELLTLAGVLPFALFGLRRKRRSLAAFLLLAGTLGALTGCGSLYPAHTPPGTYDLVITATGAPDGASATSTQTLHIGLTVMP